MQVILNVDSTQLGTEVSEFMKSLSIEDKRALTTQILNDYYSQYEKYDKSEKQLMDKEAIEYVKKEDYYARDSKKSDEELRQSRYYTEFLNRTPTMAERIRKEISSKVQEELSKTVREFVEKDPQYKLLVEQSLETVKSTFPQMVQQAMVQHMAGQLPQLVAQIQGFSQVVSDQVNQLNNRLSSKGF